MKHPRIALLAVAAMLAVAAAGEAAGAPAAQPAAAAASPTDAEELAQRTRPTDREPVYEFARPPTIRVAGRDRYEISFATKARCDVAVCVEDAAGRIVRYLGYGVLGPNAPAPFRKDALEQTLVWDGKDRLGKYVANPAGHRFRVSLGLNPTFDRVIAWHPKDTSAGKTISAISADADGVYVLETCGYSQLRAYDHDGNYVRTLYPYGSALLGKVDIPRRDAPDAKPTPTGAKPPIMMGFGSTKPFGAVGGVHRMAAAAGRLAISTRGGYGDNRRLLRMTTAGTSPPEGMTGAAFGAPNLVHRANERAPMTFGSDSHMAMSPDGKWVYVSGLAVTDIEGRPDLRMEPKPYCWNAVFRFPWDAPADYIVVNHESFLGEVSSGPKRGAGNDATHLDRPRGLDCDAAGRLYVCDYGNDRIQVVGADGKVLKSIPIRRPREIAVHRKTGELYVVCYEFERLGLCKNAMTVVKLSAPDFAAGSAAPKALIEMTIPGPGGDYRFTAFTPVMGLDSWSSPPRLWLTWRRGDIRVFDDAGDRFKKAFDFTEQVREAGFTPAIMADYKQGCIYADPVRGHIYRGSSKCGGPWVRMDPEDGRKWSVLKPAYGLMSGHDIEEVHVGLDGLLVARTLKFLVRFDPAAVIKGGDVLGPEAEIPFDYGETLADREGGKPFNGVLKFPWAMGGANGFNNGLAVAANGDVLIITENYADFESFAGNARIMDDARNAFRRESTDRYLPRIYPGRKGSGAVIWRWDSRGELTGEDLVPGLEVRTSGIRGDLEGNLYVGVGYHQNVGGKIHVGGALAKFPPSGGKLVNTVGRVKMAESELPGRPPDFFDATTGVRIWAYHMRWSYPGLDRIYFVDENGARYPCHCAVAKFDTDPYGRSFVPKAYAFCVGVVDTNGNRVCEVGRYGNPDSPAMKPGDTDIGLASCSFLTTVPDRWLYLNDDANLRIIRLKLGYKAEARVGIVPADRAVGGMTPAPDRGESR